jgi:8-oxo-dGTP diphosphatase
MNTKNIVQKVVVGGVIFNDNKVLIVQRNSNEDVFPNLWELPSGKKEVLETADDALIREIFEETGIKVKIIMPFDIFNYQIEKPDAIKDSTQINYLVKLENNSEVKLSSEHQKFAWINEAEVDDYNLSESTKNTIKKAFTISKKNVLL